MQLTFIICACEDAAASPAWSRPCRGICGLLRLPIFGWDIPMLGPIAFPALGNPTPRTGRTLLTEYWGPFIIWFGGCDIDILTFKCDVAGIELNIGFWFCMFELDNDDNDIDDNVDELLGNDMVLLDTKLLLSWRKWDDTVGGPILVCSTWGGDVKLFVSGLLTALLKAEFDIPIPEFVTLLVVLLGGVGAPDKICESCWCRWLALSWLLLRSWVSFAVPFCEGSFSSSGRSVTMLSRRKLNSEKKKKKMKIFWKMKKTKYYT